MDTHGRKLILTLLAKPVAKINAGIDSEHDEKIKAKRSKRKNISDESNREKL